MPRQLELAAEEPERLPGLNHCAHGGFHFCDLETERLTLKSIGFEDAAFFFKEFSTDEVSTYLYDAEPCASIEVAKEWIAFFTEPEPRTQHRRLLVRKAEKAGFVRTEESYFEHFRGKDYPHDIYCKML